jgi:3-deoxy-D-manno-octulosonic-acid transferase
VLLSAYRLATWLAGPLIGLYLQRRKAKGREDPVRLPERLGHAGHPRPEGKLVWCHAASVGEAVSVLPLLERFDLEHEGWRVLLTTGTVTSAKLVEERAQAGLIHQFVPVDRPGAVNRFLDHWQPDLAIWVESELWPNLIRQTKARGIPMALLNGRMSAKSANGWRRWPRTIQALLGAFDLILPQTTEDAARFMRLGALHVEVRGNLKGAAPPLPYDAGELRQLQAIVGSRPCWVAASVHPGEDEVVAAVHELLISEIPDLLTIIVPRHPHRGQVWAETTLAHLNPQLRSRGDWPDGQIYIADTLGELGLFYRLASVTFVGGSLVEIGGHNPLEPARLGAAILLGPYIFNFAEVCQTLRAAGGAYHVQDAQSLAKAVWALLDDPPLRAQMIDAAARVAVSETQVLDQVLAALEPLIADAEMFTPEGTPGHASP